MTSEDITKNEIFINNIKRCFSKKIMKQYESLTIKIIYDNNSKSAMYEIIDKNNFQHYYEYKYTRTKNKISKKNNKVNENISDTEIDVEMKDTTTIEDKEDKYVHLYKNQEKEKIERLEKEKKKDKIEKSNENLLSISSNIESNKTEDNKRNLNSPISPLNKKKNRIEKCNDKYIKLLYDAITDFVKKNGINNSNYNKEHIMVKILLKDIYNLFIS